MAISIDAHLLICFQNKLYVNYTHQECSRRVRHQGLNYASIRTQKKALQLMEGSLFDILLHKHIYTLLVTHSTSAKEQAC